MTILLFLIVEAILLDLTGAAYMSTTEEQQQHVEDGVKCRCSDSSAFTLSKTHQLIATYGSTLRCQTQEETRGKALQKKNVFKEFEGSFKSC